MKILTKIGIGRHMPPKLISDEISLLRKISGWLIHLFTASAAIAGLFTLYAIYKGDYIFAFWLMAVTIFIDSVDGTLARQVGVKIVVPRIDGTLLDNIVDYLNYVITPAFFVLVGSLMHGYFKVIAASMIVLSSAYQFTQADAKTSDHFFKGFPSYWNLVVFYLFLGETSSIFNFIVITLLTILVFIPIKYLYLTRIDNVTKSKPLRAALILATIVYGLATLVLLAQYPTKNPICIAISWGFGLLYVLVSLYRTFVPVDKNA